MDESKTFLQMIMQTFEKEESNPDMYSALALAYIGDGVYDLIIRTLVVEKGNHKVNQMHRQTSNVVKAEAQAKMMRLLTAHLTEEEEHVYKRGRNTKSATTAKNASVVDYRVATGFEALLGYLYLDNRMERLLELVKLGMKLVRESEQVPINSEECLNGD